MSNKQMTRKATAADREFADVIRKAQEQPGIADLMALMEQSDEVETLAREQREAAIVTKVVSATATTN